MLSLTLLRHWSSTWLPEAAPLRASPCLDASARGVLGLGGGGVGGLIQRRIGFIQRRNSEERERERERERIVREVDAERDRVTPHRRRDPPRYTCPQTHAHTNTLSNTLSTHKHTRTHTHTHNLTSFSPLGEEVVIIYIYLGRVYTYKYQSKSSSRGGLWRVTERRRRGG